VTYASSRRAAVAARSGDGDAAGVAGWPQRSRGARAPARAASPPLDRRPIIVATRLLRGPVRARARRLPHARLVFDPLVSLWDTFRRRSRSRRCPRLEGQRDPRGRPRRVHAPRPCAGRHPRTRGVLPGRVRLSRRDVVSCRRRPPGASRRRRRGAAGEGEPVTVFQYGKWSPMHGAETVLAAADLLRERPSALCSPARVSFRGAARRHGRRVSRMSTGSARSPRTNCGSHAGRRRRPRRVRRLGPRRHASWPNKYTTRLPAADPSSRQTRPGSVKRSMTAKTRSSSRPVRPGALRSSRGSPGRARAGAPRRGRAGGPTDAPTRRSPSPCAARGAG